MNNTIQFEPKWNEPYQSFLNQDLSTVIKAILDQYSLQGENVSRKIILRELTVVEQNIDQPVDHQTVLESKDIKVLEAVKSEKLRKENIKRTQNQENAHIRGKLKEKARKEVRDYWKPGEWIPIDRSLDKNWSAALKEENGSVFLYFGGYGRKFDGKLEVFWQDPNSGMWFENLNLDDDYINWVEKCLEWKESIRKS